MTVDLSSEKVRVLHMVGGKLFEGGTASVVRDLVTASSKSVSNWIWVHRDCPEEMGLPFISAGSSEIVSASVVGDLVGAARDLPILIKTIKQLRISVIHAHSRFGIFAGWLAHQLTGVPLIVHLHFLAGRLWLYRFIVRSAHATPIYNSRRTREHYKGVEGPTHVVMPTIEWPKDNLPESSVARLVAASALVPNKNVDKIIEACQVLQGRDRPLNLVIYGLLPEKIAPSMQQRILRKYSSIPYVSFVDWTRRWTDLLRSRDIFVHAGTSESFGLTILEAFARGLKIVVPQPSFLELFPGLVAIQGVYYISSPSVENLVSGIRAAMNDPVQPHYLRDLRQTVSSQFSNVLAAEKINAIYRSLA